MPPPDDLTLDALALDFDKVGGRVTVVAQDAASGAVLMVAHADREALERTLESREMHYLSRTRGAWHKGATSGNTQRLVSLIRDCDGDAVLARVLPAGPACHTGTTSCFGDVAGDAFGELATVVVQRAGAAPAGSYTAALLGDRNRRLKKLGEETAELIAACADGDAERATEEAADLIYHVAVALHAAGTSLERVRETLARRRAAGG